MIPRWFERRRRNQRPNTMATIDEPFFAPQESFVSIRMNSCSGCCWRLRQTTHADVIDPLGHVADDGTAHAAPRRVPAHLREVWRPASLPHDESGERILRGNFHVRVHEFDAVDPGLNSSVSDTGSRVGFQQQLPLVPPITYGF